ncbi:MAG: hypothetical protein JXB49_26375 [Bacteroidales bacterium]|nr:hypothetical protein [Bacteroidales bacterium]
MHINLLTNTVDRFRKDAMIKYFYIASSIFFVATICYFPININKKYYPLILVDSITLVIVASSTFFYYKKKIRLGLASNILVYSTLTNFFIACFYFRSFPDLSIPYFWQTIFVSILAITVTGFCANKYQTLYAIAYFITFLIAFITITKFEIQWYIVVSLIAAAIGFFVGSIFFLKALKKSHIREIDKGYTKLRNEQQAVIKEKERHVALSKKLNVLDKELTSKALHLIELTQGNNRMIKQLKALKQKQTKKKDIREIDNIIRQHEIQNKNALWDDFETSFKNIHEDFYRKLHGDFPELSPAERKLAALLRLSFSSKQIAILTSTEPQSVDVARSRLRKKLGLYPEQNLLDFLIQY